MRNHSGQADYVHETVIVGVPVYNEGTYIRQTLESLAAQDWSDFLAVISDNASTDATGSICKSFADLDRRFAYIRHSANVGAVKNFDFVLHHTRSRYFMWLGAHDLLAPTFLTKHIAALDRWQHASLSYAHTQWIDENGDHLDITDASNLAAVRGTPAGRYITSVRQIDECTAINSLFRREALRGKHQDMAAASDHILLSRLLFWGPFSCVPEPLYLRRKFKTRRVDYMQTMTATAGRARDHRETIAAYMRDFDDLGGAEVSHMLRRLQLRFALWQRFEAKNVNVRKMLRRFVPQDLLRRPSRV